MEYYLVSIIYHCFATFFFFKNKSLLLTIILQVLAVCLLAEVGKGRGSWWHPYLMQLPRTYDTLANFNQFEIQALQVPFHCLLFLKIVPVCSTCFKHSMI